MPLDLGTTTGPAQAFIGAFEAADSARRTNIAERQQKSNEKQQGTENAFAALNALAAVEARNDAVSADMDRERTDRTGLLLQEQTALQFANNAKSSADPAVHEQAVDRYNAIKTARMQADARLGELTQRKVQLSNHGDMLTRFLSQTSVMNDLVHAKSNVEQLLGPTPQQAAPSAPAQEAAPTAPAAQPAPAAPTQEGAPAAAPAAAPTQAAVPDQGAQDRLAWVQQSVDPNATIGKKGEVVLHAVDYQEAADIARKMDELSVRKFNEKGMIPFDIVNAERQQATEARDLKMEEQRSAKAMEPAVPALQAVGADGATPESVVTAFEASARAAASDKNAAMAVWQKLAPASQQAAKSLVQSGDLEAFPMGDDVKYRVNLFSPQNRIASRLATATASISESAKQPLGGGGMPKIELPSPVVAVDQFERIVGHGKNLEADLQKLGNYVHGAAIINGKLPSSQQDAIILTLNYYRMHNSHASAYGPMIANTLLPYFSGKQLETLRSDYRQP